MADNTGRNVAIIIVVIVIICSFCSVGGGLIYYLTRPTTTVTPTPPVSPPATQPPPVVEEPPVEEPPVEEPPVVEEPPPVVEPPPVEEPVPLYDITYTSPITSAGESTNKWISMFCTEPVITEYPANQNCKYTFDVKSARLKTECKTPSGSTIATDFNMARCTDCNILVRDGKPQCNINYSTCPNEVWIDGKDLPANDMTNFTPVANESCSTTCERSNCNYLIYAGDNNTCYPKQGVASNEADSGMMTYDSRCPTYYIVPSYYANSNAKELGQINGTLSQCQQACAEKKCDLYIYYPEVGQCIMRQASEHSERSIVLPISKVKI